MENTDDKQTSVISNLLILFLIGVYIVYSGQLVVGLSLIGFYTMGLCFVKSFCSNEISKEVYQLFFIIYGFLLIYTQFKFIDINEPFPYFNHSDASGSFFNRATMDVGPRSWSTLINGTIFKSFYSDYPLFAFWINLWKLIGWDVGISADNMRLFLRMQDLMFSPSLLAILAIYFNEIGLSEKRILKWCVLFGIFSYLFLTSVVFTRDLHIAFFYTLLGYYCLSPEKHRFILIKFTIIIAICAGLRPENGMFAVIFPIYYYLKNTQPTDAKLYFYIFLIIPIIVSYGYIDRFLDAAVSFGERTASVNQGGLFEIFNSMPFPLNSIFLAVYSFIMPYPLTFYVTNEHIGWLGLPSIFMPILNITMFLVIYNYLKRYNGNFYILYMFIISIIFTILNCSIEPNVRRAFAIIPIFFMLFINCVPAFSQDYLSSIFKRVSVFVVIINVPAILYLYFLK